MAIKSILGGKSKNLFDISQAKIAMRDDGSFYSTEKYTSNFYALSVEAGQTYTLSCDCSALSGAGSELQLACQTGTGYTLGTRLFVWLTTEEEINAWQHIVQTFTVPDNVTQVYFSTLSNTKYFRNFQIEKGSTATDYVPYDITSYKSIMKVSDVCQLIEANTRVIVDRGVTYTNNGDGSITINGTPTGTYYSVGEIAFDIKSIKFNHKYLAYSTDYHPIGSQLILADYQGGYFFRVANQIFTFLEHDYTRFVFEMRVNLNQTANNIVVRPQFFDLTEMFGAGNEPKTVAEFKAKFPNDYYPYSPACFVTSFDERMPCKTKNLFDINANSEKGYYDEQGNFYLDPRFLCFTIDVLNNNTYCISTSKLGAVKGIVSFWNNSTFVSAVNYGEQTAFAYTVPSGANKLKFVIENNQKYSNIQIEKGSTATDYVPYGYV